MEQTLDFHVKANNLPWIAILKGLISHLVHFFKGDIYTAFQLSQNAVQTSEETGDIHSKLFAYSCHGVILYAKGYLNEAKSALLKGLEYSETANQLWWMAGCNIYLGDVYFYIGKYQKSKNHYLNAIDLLEKAKMYPSFLNFSKVALTRTEVIADTKKIDIDSLQTHASENKFEILHGMTKRYIAEINLHSGSEHLPGAKEWIKQSIKVDKKNGMQHQLGQDYATYAEIYKQQGQKAKAKENFGKAIEILNECGADGWVEKYEKELAALQ